MGRPRKPTEQHERDGTLRHDRHGSRTKQPRFDGEPERPAGLSADAKRHWDEVVPALIAKGVAKAIDAPALAAMCEQWSEYCSAKQLRAHDLLEKRQRQMLINAALKAWRDLAARFGMTPVDRAKLEVEPNGQEANPFKDMLQGPKAKAPGKGK